MRSSQVGNHPSSSTATLRVIPDSVAVMPNATNGEQEQVGSGVRAVVVPRSDRRWVP